MKRKRNREQWWLGLLFYNDNYYIVHICFPGGSAGKESACNVGDLGSILGLGRSPGEGNGYPLQYSGLENSVDCIVHGVAKSQTWLSNFHSLTHFCIAGGFFTIWATREAHRKLILFISTIYYSQSIYILPISQIFTFFIMKG